jgi:hypothetical protein
LVVIEVVVLSSLIFVGEAAGDRVVEVRLLECLSILGKVVLAREALDVLDRLTPILVAVLARDEDFVYGEVTDFRVPVPPRWSEESRRLAEAPESPY